VFRQVERLWMKLLQINPSKSLITCHTAAVKAAAETVTRANYSEVP
jgi:hypothetical protein